MSMKFKSILGVSLLALGLQLSSSAQAAPSECSVSGILSAGGQLQGDTIWSDSAGSGSLSGSWGELFGEAAGLVTCDAWNFQADFADHNHSFAARGKNFSAPAIHFGGDIFWRDPRSGDYGFQASYINQNSVLGIADGTSDIGRFGLFGNYYLNDQVSIGADAHYFTSLHNTFRSKGGGKSYHGFELSANAKYYVTPDLKLSLFGTYLNSSSTIATGVGDLREGGGAVALQADYQFNDSGLTGFIGGRLAHRVYWTDVTGGNFNLDDRQVYVGLSLPLGAKPGSLVEHDRTGPVNNTSLFLEDTPDPINSILAVSLQH